MERAKKIKVLKSYRKCLETIKRPVEHKHKSGGTRLGVSSLGTYTSSKDGVAFRNHDSNSRDIIRKVEKTMKINNWIDNK